MSHSLRGDFHDLPTRAEAYRAIARSCSPTTRASMSVRQDFGTKPRRNYPPSARVWKACAPSIKPCCATTSARPMRTGSWSMHRVTARPVPGRGTSASIASPSSSRPATAQPKRLHPARPGLYTWRATRRISRVQPRFGMPCSAGKPLSISDGVASRMETTSATQTASRPASG